MTADNLIFKHLSEVLNSYVLGQKPLIQQLLVAPLSGGHIILEGVPGTGKTLLIKVLARLIQADFRRIQLTPDILPSDILGTNIFDLNSRNFTLKKGPIFTELLLTDEINRTPPKTQAALLEAMEEQQVTLDGETLALPDLFWIAATQNPLEFEGTYPLPEAQLDRFMFMVNLDYPSFEQEMAIVKSTTSNIKTVVNKVLGADDIILFQDLVRKVPVADNVVEYAVRLVHKTRPNIEGASEESKKFLEWGAGPRASQNLVLAAKCHALINGKYSPDIEDVKAVAFSVLRHRIVRNFKAEAEGMSTEEIIKKLM